DELEPVWGISGRIPKHARSPGHRAGRSAPAFRGESEVRSKAPSGGNADTCRTLSFREGSGGGEVVIGFVLRPIGLTIALSGAAAAQVTRLLEPALLDGSPSITPDGRFVVW